ncbi:MAG TPA: MFS transporter, partial [Polyangiaceae bacterium]
MDGPDQRRARLTAWSLSWLSYATYYVGRKGFGVVKLPLSRELGLDVAALGLIDTAFLAAYTAGQFLSGYAGDRFGARRLVGYGMLGSALACALFGLSSGLLALVVCFVLNGFAQSTGWPGNTRVMAEWTTVAQRGTVMGIWSTCYQVGGVAATFLAGEVAERYGWRASFQVAAVVLFGVGLVVL